MARWKNKNAHCSTPRLEVHVTVNQEHTQGRPHTFTHQSPPTLVRRTLPCTTKAAGRPRVGAVASIGVVVVVVAVGAQVEDSTPSPEAREEREEHEEEAEQGPSTSPEPPSNPSPSPSASSSPTTTTPPHTEVVSPHGFSAKQGLWLQGHARACAAHA
jgi:hypothetical protein